MKSFLNFITESEKREENLGSVDILGYPHELRISAHANEPREQPLWFGIQEYNSLIKFAERRFEKNVINVDRLKKEPRKSYNLENKRIINIVKKGLNKIFNQQSKLFKSEFQKMFEGYQEPKELNPYFTNFNLIYNPLNHGELYSMSRLQEFYKWVNETEEGKKLTEEKNGKKYNGEDVKKFIQILNSSMDKRYNAILIAIGRLNSQLGSNQNHIKDSSKRSNRTNIWRGKTEVHFFNSITIKSFLCRGVKLQSYKAALINPNLNFSMVDSKIIDTRNIRAEFINF